MATAAPKEPGSSWDNPVWYRGYRIYLGDYIPAARFAWNYTHKDYDGPEDRRHGCTDSIQSCKSDIDELEDE